MSEKNYDDLLCPILCSEGSIVSFFDRIFDFLNRRTDYFKIKSSKDAEAGFEMGEPENILRSVFCKYMEEAMAKYKSEINDSFQVSPPIDFIAEEVIETTEVPSAEPGIFEEKHYVSQKIETQPSKDEVKTPWMDPDCYNGAWFDDYSWAQTITDVDVRIKVPEYITNGKQVRVKIKQEALTAEVFSDGNWSLLKGGYLTWKINVEESTWTLVPGEHVHICLQKIQERWWDSLFVGEPKIDMKSIDPSIAYEDLDAESRAKISELMYNEQQKRLGKPTIQQNKIQNVLKEAWNAEGSPFKGQEFDPSLVDIQNASNF